MNWPGKFAKTLKFLFPERGVINMEYKAVIKKSGNWWIGWLIDLPGVNGQGKNKERLIESLRIGAADMLNVPFEPKDEEELVKIEV
jgi:predicted RNase H-like HicB family nuclease